MKLVSYKKPQKKLWFRSKQDRILLAVSLIAISAYLLWAMTS